jgi:hypothetical protein
MNLPPPCLYDRYALKIGNGQGGIWMFETIVVMIVLSFFGLAAIYADKIEKHLDEQSKRERVERLEQPSTPKKPVAKNNANTRKLMK